jgi:hypothetical protein
MRTISTSSEQYWVRLYWFMRAGMTLLWIWTAFVSWFVFPRTDSLGLLRQLGITQYENQVFAAACVMDAAMGIASALFASSKLWLAQMGLVIFYSIAIAIGLPEFLFQPFGPITKNLAVLACLGYLNGMERRSRSK